MKRILTITVALVILTLSGCAKQTQPNLPEPLSTAEVVAKVSPSVVQIVTADGTGSGTILDTDGHVLTNNHVVEKAASANVVLADGRTLPAQIVSRDWSMDLALLKVADSDLKPATLGSSSQVQLGEDVLTLGFPLALGSSVTVTKGIVSAFRQPYVQTDAPVNPGNSGGPLVNMWGEVIGLVTAKPLTQDQEPAEGIGFAVAIDQVKDTLTVLLSPQKLSSLAAYASVTDLPEAEAGLFAVDSLGNVHLVWDRPGDPWNRCGVLPKLMYSMKSKDGGWSTPEMVAEAPSMCGDDLFRSYLALGDIAVDRDGTVHVVWTQNPVRGSFNIDAAYASKPVGQVWSTPTVLGTGHRFQQAILVIDSADTLHLVCTEDRGWGSESGISYLFKPKQDVWSQSNLIEGTRQSETDLIEGPSLSCDSQGNLYLVYYHYDDQTATWTGPMYTRKPAGATWTVPTPMFQTTGLRKPQLIQLVVDSDHESLLACEDADGRIAYSSLLPDQSWSAIQYLSVADHRCTSVRLARAASGTIYAAWTRNANPEDTVGSSLVLRWKSPGNPWSPEYLVREGVSMDAFVVDSTGNTQFLLDAYQYLVVALAQVIN